MKPILASAAALFLVSSTGFASPDITGSTVTGGLFFGGEPSVNYFDPANGYVPSGYANETSPTVTIGSSTTTFGYYDGANLDTASFTGTELTITDVETFPANPWTMTFVDSQLTGLSEISDTFNNGGVNGTLAGDEITISWAGGGTTGTGDFSATFNFVNTGSADPSVPDGGTTAGLLGLAMAGLGCLKRGKLFAS